MVQSVELLLDDRLDASVRREWRQVSGTGIRGQDAVRQVSNRPHITLAVAQHIDPETDLELQRGLLAPALQITLGGLVVFGGHRKTLAHLVVPTAGLLSLQRTVFRLMHHSEGIPAHTHPGDWTPHVTLARRVLPEQIGTAICAVSATHLTGHAVSIRRWDGEAKREWLIA
jgi:2'-5' RNA ligase